MMITVLGLINALVIAVGLVVHAADVDSERETNAITTALSTQTTQP